jgi:hypothetical protein
MVSSWWNGTSPIVALIGLIGQCARNCTTIDMISCNGSAPSAPRRGSLRSIRSAPAVAAARASATEQTLASNAVITHPWR